MRLIETVSEMHAARAELSGPVALVATLGGLHRGHEALLDHARSVGRSLVSSLFLNPTQFNDPADLESYPADRARDLEVLEHHGVDVVFAPTVTEMYPEGASTEVDPGRLARILEGAHRPGHFVGVATIVTKLLTILRPDIAVWGAKDAQQNVVIRRVTRDLGMRLDHRIVPTVRAGDGLALSSRNRRLGPEERTRATALHAALMHALERWRGGERSADRLRRTVRDHLAESPLVSTDYVSVADPDTLEELETATPGALLSLAATVGTTRLIDNVTLD